MAVIFLCLSMIVGGCASKPKAPASKLGVASASAGSYDDDSVAAALVFDPPIAANEPPLDLARDTRQPSAFVGYDQLTTTFFNISTVDYQRINNFRTGGDRYLRTSVSDRFGVNYR